MNSIQSSVYFVLFICLLLTSCQENEPLPILGFPELDEAGNEVSHQVEEFDFVSHLGDTFQSTEIRNSVRVMNYFFTSCPTICPTMTRNLTEAFDEYKDDDEVNFLSFSVDPIRDQPSRLRRFMESHALPDDSNWTFLTGDKQRLYDFAREQLYLSAMDVETEIDEDFIHSEKVVLVDMNNHIRGYYTGTEPTDIDRLIRDIKRLKKEGK